MEAAEETSPDEHLKDALDRLHGLLFREGPLEDAMRRIAALAAIAIPACDLCSVSIVDGDRIITTASNDVQAEHFDRYQYDSGDGPCMTASRTGVVQKVPALAREERWPDFGALALADGLKSVMSVPLPLDRTFVGALNLYSLSGSFEADDDWMSESFARQAAITLANAEAYQSAQDLASNLTIALESRDIIGQAKGIIMERQRCPTDEAFDILRGASQRRNVKLRDLAQDVVDTGTWE
jgi:GAF domain-containing protein